MNSNKRLAGKPFHTRKPTSWLRFGTRKMDGEAEIKSAHPFKKHIRMVQHQRVKNLAVKENINTQQAGLSNVIVTDSHNDKAEREFLELLKIKKELGVISEEDIKQLVPGNTDPVERLTIDILKNLNKYTAQHLPNSKKSARSCSPLRESKWQRNWQNDTWLHRS